MNTKWHWFWRNIGPCMAGLGTIVIGVVASISLFHTPQSITDLANTIHDMKSVVERINFDQVKVLSAIDDLMNKEIDRLLRLIKAGSSLENILESEFGYSTFFDAQANISNQFAPEITMQQQGNSRFFVIPDEKLKELKTKWPNLKTDAEKYQALDQAIEINLKSRTKKSSP